ncbi:MAG: beta-lactamase family protein [Proteobacteria bacterium]|nr:beta-lactamase family protein [Pseudomonadota bacterium]
MPSIETINGQWADQFEAVAQAFSGVMRLEHELGGSFCVVRDGRVVVDVWGGHADAERREVWREDTLVNVWSTTKGMLALCIARLTDQGLLAYDRPVADYWPQFGAAGKGEVTVAQLFSHQAGLCGPARPLDEDELYDVEAVADLLALEAPHWSPGSRSGYHALSIGYLGHGLVRRVTGKSVGAYFRDELAGPGGLDIHLGASGGVAARVAQIHHDGKPQSGGEATFNEFQRLAQVHMPIRAGIANDPRWKAMGISSAGGSANARDLARLYGALATDRRIDGRELVSAEALGKATTCQIENEDLVLRFPMTWGIGFALNRAMGVYGPNPRAFGHHGWGGSFAFADPDRGLGVAYAMNFMREPDGAPDPRMTALIEAVYASL